MGDTTDEIARERIDHVAADVTECKTDIRTLNSALAAHTAKSEANHAITQAALGEIRKTLDQPGVLAKLTDPKTIAGVTALIAAVAALAGVLTGRATAPAPPPAPIAISVPAPTPPDPGPSVTVP